MGPHWGPGVEPPVDAMLAGLFIWPQEEWKGNTAEVILQGDYE